MYKVFIFFLICLNCFNCFANMPRPTTPIGCKCLERTAFVRNRGRCSLPSIHDGVIVREDIDNEKNMDRQQKLLLTIRASNLIQKLAMNSPEFNCLKRFDYKDVEKYRMCLSLYRQFATQEELLSALMQRGISGISLDVARQIEALLEQNSNDSNTQTLFLYLHGNS